MVVRGETSFGKPYEHPIGDLSSGEKQMLLLMGFVAATLRDSSGLIDEPDLHIHVVMVPQLLGSIETIVPARRRGQLIVASHSQEVWDWFSLSSERRELTPLAEGHNVSNPSPPWVSRQQDRRSPEQESPGRRRRSGRGAWPSIGNGSISDSAPRGRIRSTWKTPRIGHGCCLG